MDKRIIISGVVLAILTILFLGTQVIVLNGELDKERTYSSNLDRIDKEMFLLNSKALKASTNSGICGVNHDIECLENMTKQIDEVNAQFAKKVAERNKLKDK